MSLNKLEGKMADLMTKKMDLEKDYNLAHENHKTAKNEVDIIRAKYNENVNERANIDSDVRKNQWKNKPMWFKALVNGLKGLYDMFVARVQDIRTLFIDKGGNYIVLGIIVMLALYGFVSSRGPPPTKRQDDPDAERARLDNMSIWEQYVYWLQKWLGNFLDFGYGFRQLIGQKVQETPTDREVLSEGRCDNETMIETNETYTDPSNNQVPACIVASTPSVNSWTLDTTKFDQWESLPKEDFKDPNTDKLTLYMPYKLSTDHTIMIPDCSNTYYKDSKGDHHPVNMYNDAQGGCVPNEINRTAYSNPRQRAGESYSYVK